MSFILDALKKSETDRQRQSAPALFEVKVAAPRRRFPMWAVGVAALLLVNVVVVSWLLLRKPAEGVAPSAAGTVPPPVATAASAPQAQPGMVTVTIPSTTVNIPVNPAGAISAAPEPGVVGASQAPPLAEEPLLSSDETPVPPDYDSRDYQPAITPAQANSIAAARRNAPPTRDQVLARGTQLPDLRLDMHVYAEDVTKRFVFINMRKLREGESMPDGVRVEEITPTGVRLAYQGTQFSLERP